MNKRTFVVRIKGKADFEKALTVHGSTAEDAFQAGIDTIAQRDFDSYSVDTIRFRVDPAEGEPPNERASRSN